MAVNSNLSQKIFHWAIEDGKYNAQQKIWIIKGKVHWIQSFKKIVQVIKENDSISMYNMPYINVYHASLPYCYCLSLYMFVPYPLTLSAIIMLIISIFVKVRKLMRLFTTTHLRASLSPNATRKVEAWAGGGAIMAIDSIQTSMLWARQLIT